MNTADAMARGRADNSARRRQKVIEAISQAARDGGDLTASAIAQRAGVDRSFLYRHRGLLEQLHRAQAAEASGPAADGARQLVSRESLKADPANARDAGAGPAAKEPVRGGHDGG